MKKAFSLLPFLCLSIFLFAQTTLTSFEPIAKKPRISALLSNANQDGTIGISYPFNGKLYWNAVDKTGQVIEKMGISAGTTQSIPKGTIYSDTHFFHFYKNADNQNIQIIQAERNGKNGKLFSKKLLAKKERFIGAIADKNIFFLLALNKKGKELKVFKFNPEQTDFETTIIPIKDFLADKLHKVKFFPIREKDLIQPYQAAILLKSYVLDADKLLLTIDGEKARGHGTTELLTIDLKEGTINNKILGKSDLELEGHTKALVFKDKIYRITATKNLLNIGIYELSDLSLIQAYSYTPQEEINILDSPFYSESEGNNGFYLFNPAKKDKTIDKTETKKLLKKLAVGAPFIIATALDEQQTLLTIGTHIVANQNGYFMPGVAGGTVNTPNGPVSMPGTPGTYIGGSGNSYKQSRFFYTLIDSTSLEHVSTTDKVTKTIHPVHKFVDNTLTDKHVSTVVPYGDKTAVVHYLRSDRLIEVEIFE